MEYLYSIVFLILPVTLHASTPIVGIRWIIGSSGQVRTASNGIQGEYTSLEMPFAIVSAYEFILGMVGRWSTK